MTLCGIDSGSTVTKIAAVVDGTVVRTASAPTGTDPVKSGTTLLAALRGELPGEMKVCVTGYGRKLLAGLGSQKTEISCHALGAQALVTGAVTVPGSSSLQPPASSLHGFILLDIGGQDSKAIKVGADGRAADFAMNDKCAAGTGRFLEVIGRTLGFGIDGISSAAIGSGRKARLSSMCTVFADSEVVSLTARGERPDEIAWAACYAVAERCAGLVKRMGAKDVLVFTGGVSDLQAVAEALREILKVDVVSPPLARFSGAIGAALYAGK
jgi:predicted CoA-substrate-specific enzyme activase